MNPGGGSGRDEPPLDIQVPDDARELDRDVLAYHRELRAQRRRNRLRRLGGPFAAHGTLMPLLASILASSGIRAPCPANGLVSFRSLLRRRRARSSRW